MEYASLPRPSTNFLRRWQRVRNRNKRQSKPTEGVVLACEGSMCSGSSFSTGDCPVRARLFGTEVLQDDAPSSTLTLHRLYCTGLSLNHGSSRQRLQKRFNMAEDRVL